jgi:hypothetical protein
MLFGFVSVTEKAAVPTQSRTEHVGPAGDRVTEGLIQGLPASVALFSQEETQGTDGSNFSSAEPHRYTILCQPSATPVSIGASRPPPQDTLFSHFDRSIPAKVPPK